MNLHNLYRNLERELPDKTFSLNFEIWRHCRLAGPPRVETKYALWVSAWGERFTGADCEEVYNKFCGYRDRLERKTPGEVAVESASIAELQAAVAPISECRDRPDEVPDGKQSAS